MARKRVVRERRRSDRLVERDILRYLGRHPGRDQVEIADALRLDLRVVSRLCRKLEAEGTIYPVTGGAMTERFKGFLVTLEKNVRQDDAEATIRAIEQVKGVLSVKPLVANIDSQIAEERVRMDFYQKLVKVLEERS